MAQVPVRRAGRPPEAERQQRRGEALDALLAVITDVGYERLTMQAVAARAGSSKESLYAWFGSKEGMVAELIRQQSAATNLLVAQAVETDRPAADVLRGIAESLLTLLTGETSLALNRAAISSPALAAVLLAHGRHTTGPIIEGYLARIGVRDPRGAFTLLYGLVVRDSQIRALLGEPPPSPAERSARAAEAVEAFLLVQA